ncbi:MAG: calcium/sodium antiporter [Candidatus Magasanikbacteria bacterium]|nr:calcium/sodium antiporter [Candidatus Magasanikbacteria bacterium]
MFLAIFLLLIGIAILIGGAEALVRGSASMARKLGVSTIVIGLTIVAFGTSAPELVVNLFSAVKGTTDLAIANVIGSNLANILLILGVGATITTLQVKKGTTYKEVPFAFLAIILVGIMGNDTIFDGNGFNVLGRIDGIVFLAFFGIFIYYTYGISKVSGEQDRVEIMPWKISILLFFMGITGLVLGGQLIVSNAIKLATIAGLSEALIGLTIVAVGTSLPELATTIVAIRKNHTDLAIGNAIGSNIFNVFWILGITATIKPLPFDTHANMDVIFTTLATFLLFMFIFVGKRHRLSRKHGIAFLILYFSYIAFAIIR